MLCDNKLPLDDSYYTIIPRSYPSNCKVEREKGLEVLILLSLPSLSGKTLQIVLCVQSLSLKGLVHWLKHC